MCSQTQSSTVQQLGFSQWQRMVNSFFCTYTETINLYSVVHSPWLPLDWFYALWSIPWHRREDRIFSSFLNTDHIWRIEDWHNSCADKFAVNNMLVVSRTAQELWEGTSSLQWHSNCECSKRAGIILIIIATLPTLPLLVLGGESGAFHWYPHKPYAIREEFLTHVSGWKASVTYPSMPMHKATMRE